MISSRPTTFRRCCAAAVAAALTLQPLAVYAAPITTSVLSEIPLQGLNPVKPNIMFTLDDSGSMAWDFVPDFIFGPFTGLSHCRDSLLCGSAAWRRPSRCLSPGTRRSPYSIRRSAAAPTTASSTIRPQSTFPERRPTGSICRTRA